VTSFGWADWAPGGHSPLRPSGATASSARGRQLDLETRPRALRPPGLAFPRDACPPGLRILIGLRWRLVRISSPLAGRTGPVKAEATPVGGGPPVAMYAGSRRASPPPRGPAVGPAGWQITARWVRRQLGLASRRERSDSSIRPPRFGRTPALVGSRAWSDRPARSPASSRGRGGRTWPASTLADEFSACVRGGTGPLRDLRWPCSSAKAEAAAR